jgi:hypothetical protein
MGQSVTIGLAFLVCSMAEIAIKKDTMSFADQGTYENHCRPAHARLIVSE